MSTRPCLIFAFGWALLLEFVTVAAPARVGPSAELNAVLIRIHEERKVPALAAAIVTRDGVQAIGAVGVRKFGATIQVTTNDLWHLGSDTKAITATLIARLVEKGLLHWESTISEVFPDLAASFQPDFTNVTLLHLLSHRSGIQANLDWSELSRTGEVREQRVKAVREGLSRPSQQPTGYLYSNLGYVIAGAMAERVTDKSWEELMRNEIFQPLGMHSAGFGGLGTPGELDQPWGHTKTNRPTRNNGPTADNPPVLGPAGTVHCTLSDWARFIADQLRGLNGDGALLKPESYHMLSKPPFGGDYALGWGVADREWAGGKALNHCGCNTMYFANAWLAPERGFAILVCSNLGLDAYDATDQTVAALLPLAQAHLKQTHAEIESGN
jgi:CubicO group peptidase (beta-lactamase class C family)